MSGHDALDYEEVIQISISQDIRDLVRGMEKISFGGRKFGEAFYILKAMLEQGESCKKFLGLAGAVVPGGLRKIIIEMMEKGAVDVIVSTGANITHDLMLAMNGRQLRAPSSLVDDIEIREQGYFRVHDVLSPIDDFQKLEDGLSKLVKPIEEGTYASHELLTKIGENLNQGSIVGMAAAKQIPIIIPALTDSILGVQIWPYIQQHKIAIDPYRDLKYIVDMQFDLKSKNGKSGALILGGGVPKNFIFQSASVADKPIDYLVQIVADQPEFGGSSGATPEEAKSWGKVGERANTTTVNCDFTIALPILASALLA
ncbi:MAG: deoxyhypusine synthase family protein [Nitrososphaerales archaeon]